MCQQYHTYDQNQEVRATVRKAKESSCRPCEADYVEDPTVTHFPEEVVMTRPEPPAPGVRPATTVVTHSPVESLAAMALSEHPLLAQVPSEASAQHAPWH